MSKRKILALALTLSMVAILAIGGTLAYFTDTDAKTNVFTVGNVNITLVEQERGENGLQAFTNEKKLMPIVGSAQGEKDAMGMPVAENYVDKIITVKLENSSENAYVRVYVAIPSALDNATDAGQNVLHFNFGNNFATGNYTVADHANWGAETLVAKEFAIDGVNYNIYYRTYNKEMVEGTETGSAAYVGFYFDEKVDHNGTAYTIDGEVIDFDFTKGVKIPVYAIGAQSAGFTSADAALEAAFGPAYNPWAAN